MTLTDENPRPWRPSGVITLLTDYGLDDPYVGIVKGVLWSEAAHLRAVVDLCHAVPPGDVATAAFLLERSWGTFPPGSVHVAIVDPGVGTERALLMVEVRGQVFLAHDNGLLATLIASEPMVVVRRVATPASGRGPSTTFDGRDRFAPLAARLVEGDPPSAFGELCGGPEAYQALDTPGPRRREDGSLEAWVIHVDRFGNLITNLPLIWLAEAGADWRERWTFQVGRRKGALVHTYSDAAPGTLIALGDSYDHMEVAVSGGHAARELGLGRGAVVRFATGTSATRSTDSASTPNKAGRKKKSDTTPAKVAKGRVERPRKRKSKDKTKGRKA